MAVIAVTLSFVKKDQADSNGQSSMCGISVLWWFAFLFITV
jgi:hypothetical protein